MLRILALSAALLCSTVQAQTHFGIRGGWNQCLYDSDEIWYTGKMNSFHLGGALSLGDPGASGLSVELYLSGRGVTGAQVNLEYYGLPAQAPADHKVLYLDLPLLFRISLIAEGLFVETGFNASFLLNANVSGAGLSSAEAEMTADGYKGTNFGFLGGFGYVHASGIGASVRGGLSFGDAYEEQFPGTAVFGSDEELKTQFELVQVSLLYYFGVDR
jgi:hypothetical protein